ncbi:retrovirus-related pol polyprotein from transposon TNT 1-94 [Tanacetum coccineum]
MDCDVSWKAKLSTLHDENVLLKHQVESTVKEQENIKLEFQKLFNLIKATRAQHQNEINEMFEDVTQKTYAYADVRAQNQDLLMTISKLKSKLKTTEKWKHVNTKFDKSKTLRQLLCVTPFNKNPAIKAKNMSNTKVTSDKSNPVTSYLNSVRRPKSKDNKSKNDVLQNTKNSYSYVLKTTNNVSIDSNKCETKPSNVCQTNACITSSKTINAVNDGLNMLCISCGLDVFLHSHEKCVACNVLTRKSSVKRALFTSPVAAKSKSLGATSIVAKSRFSVVKTQQQQIRRNQTLIEAARTMLIFSKAPEFLWAEAIATACFIHNRSIVHTRHNKTPCELIRDRKPNVQYFHVFGSLFYPKNDRDDLGKMKLKVDVGIFVSYSESSRGVRIYNAEPYKREWNDPRQFDELSTKVF